MIVLALLFILFLSIVSPVSAKYDPLHAPNNKYGIHVADPNDVSETADLVNSNGGDWGYVTIVIQEDDRDRDKWQRVMNQMRERHLIPIVRLATHIDGDSWTKPYKDAPQDWARFLDSLNWPIENRYVIVFNEPNHANEWGKTIDPEDYAHTLVTYARALHDKSEDFFVLPAGLDVSAASDGHSLSASDYLARMVKAEPKLFDVLDGWTSHAYPNPAFSGSPFATGRGTLRSYDWEMGQLRSLGLSRNLPIFITETGWVHTDGVQRSPGLLSSDQVAQYITAAAGGAWQDPNIVAITPFVYSYQGLPFDHFSWKRLGGDGFYPQYEAYQKLSKSAGMPRQREKYSASTKLIPETLVTGSSYTLTTLLKNEGQGIFSERNKTYDLQFSTEPRFTYTKDPIPDMEPGQFGTVTMHLETPNLAGTYRYSVHIRKSNQDLTIEEGDVTLVPPPSLTIRLQLGWRRENTAINTTVLIYEGKTLIHKVPGVAFRNGLAKIGDLRNIVPGNRYRVVVLAPFYLPRQKVFDIGDRDSDVTIPRMYPLDFNQDGTFSFQDIAAAVSLPPNFVISLFVRR